MDTFSMQVFRNEVSNIKKHEDMDLLVGVLFKFDEISKNYTMVRSGAKVRATSDAILRRHTYPVASAFHKDIAGRILRFYEDKEAKAFMCDFVLFNEDEKKKVLEGSLAFSVAWLADLYDVTDKDYIAFDDVTIYETSLVENPAFNTCASQTKDGLSCLKMQNSACGCGGKNSACGCGGQNSAENNKEMSYISKMEQEIMQAIQALQEELKALSERVAALEAKMEASTASSTESSAESEVLDSMQAQLAQHQALFKKLEGDFERLLGAVSEFVEKATKSMRYA